MNNKQDPEGWEREYWIYDKERWDDLVELRKEEAKGSDIGDGDYEELADALVLAKRYEEALTLCIKLYKNNHRNQQIHNLILQILKETNKKETDFDWIERPKVLRLDEDLFQFCKSALQKKRKVNRTMYVLQEALLIKGTYMDFDMDELLEWLKKDSRLKIVENENDISPKIEVI